MLNNFILVGKVNRGLEIKENYNDLVISVPRKYKNENGEYDTDKITVVIDNELAQNVKDYVNIGDTVGVRGVIESDNYTNQMYLRVDKLTFLTSKKGDNNDR